MKARAAAVAMPAGTVVAGVSIAAAVAYPFAVAFGLERVGVRLLALPLLALVAAAALSLSSGRQQFLRLLVQRFGLLLAVGLAALASGHPLALLMLPTLTSLWLLWTFASTLRRGTPIVEQFARSLHDEFPDFLVPYCRLVTWVWCGFFAANASVAACLALAAPARTWALYTGAISYGLLGALACGEYVFHKVYFRFYEDGWADGIWRRLCPPERTARGRQTLAWQAGRRRVPVAGGN